MPATTKLALPYPAASDPADVPLDMQELADRLDTVTGAASGLAQLDAGSKVPVAQLPAGTANGVASLDATGKVPAAQLPAAAGGGEIAYAQITANVAVPISAEAAAVTVVSAGAVVYAAVPVMIEFFASQIVVGTPGGAINFNLWDGATNLGFFGQFTVPGVFSGMLRRRLTPTAGSHTYMVKAFAGAAAGTIGAGAGGAPGTAVPAFIRVTAA